MTVKELKAAALAKRVEGALARRMTDKHLALMEIEGERAVRDGYKPSLSADELLALVGEVQAMRREST